MTSEAPGHATYLVETADVMEATATNLLPPLRQRRRPAASGGERQSATSLMRSAILEANGKRKPEPPPPPPLPLAVARLGCGWWCLVASERNEQTAESACDSPPQVWFGRLGFSGLATAAADTAGRHSAVGPYLCSFLRAPE